MRSHVEEDRPAPVRAGGAAARHDAPRVADTASHVPDFAADRRDGWLFVLPWEPTAIGGVSRVVNELAASLAQGSRFRPHILVLDWAARDPAYDLLGPATLIRMRVRDRGAPWSLQRLRYLLSRRAVERTLRQICTDLHVRVVNAHYPSEETLELLRSVRRVHPAARTIVSFHGTDVTRIAELPAPAVRHWARSLERADAVTCCSTGLLARLRATLGSPLHNGVVRHNGASRWTRPVQREPAPRAEPAAGGRRTIVSVGTYHVNKGHDVLVRAFDLVRDTHPDLDLVIFGRSGPALDDVAALVRELGLESRVTLRTDVALDDMASAYDGATMLVSASRFEPFGIAILEAGTAGLPVIATDTDGARDILVDGEDSIVVPVEDPAALARAISTLADDEALRERLSSKLRAKVLLEYQWDAIAPGWEALVADGR